RLSFVGLVCSFCSNPSVPGQEPHVRSPASHGRESALRAPLLPVSMKRLHIHCNNARHIFLLDGAHCGARRRRLLFPNVSQQSSDRAFIHMPLSVAIGCTLQIYFFGYSPVL